MGEAVEEVPELFPRVVPSDLFEEIGEEAAEEDSEADVELRVAAESATDFGGASSLMIREAIVLHIPTKKPWQLLKKRR